MSNGPTFGHIYPVNGWFVRGLNEMNEENDVASEIIDQPDRHLLSQDQVFEAEGGYSTLALSLGIASIGAMTVFASSPRMFNYYSRGMMNFPEWVCLGSTTVLGAMIGQQIGLSTFGDRRRYANHWMAYYHVKSQNRFEGRGILGDAPTY